MSSIMALPDYLSYEIKINKYFVQIEGHCADEDTYDFVIKIKFDEHVSEATFYVRYKNGNGDRECFSTKMATLVSSPLTFSEAICSVLYEFSRTVYDYDDTTTKETPEKEKERKDIASVILVIAKEFTNEILTIQGDADVEFSVPEPKDEPGKWN